MRDGGPVRAAARAFGVEVDPLVVAGRLGESVDALLVDREPVAGAEARSDGGFKFLDGREDPGFGSAHVYLPPVTSRTVPVM